MGTDYELHTTVVGKMLIDAAQASIILCVVGLVIVGINFSKAQRKDYLLAFGLMMLGLILRELGLLWVAYLEDCKTRIDLSSYYAFSLVGHYVRVLGALMFLRAATHEICGERGWLTALLVTVVASVLFWR